MGPKIKGGMGPRKGKRMFLSHFETGDGNKKEGCLFHEIDTKLETFGHREQFLRWRGGGVGT